MDFLDIMPLLAVLIGTALLFFILFRRLGLGQNKKIRLTLGGLIFIYTFMAFDYYVTISTHGNTSYFGMSYLFRHLTGFLLYIFISLFTRTSINLNKWVWAIIVYTLFRWILMYPLFQYQTLSEYLTFAHNTEHNSLLELEYLLMGVINLTLIFLAFICLRNAPIVMDLNEKQSLNLKWVKMVLSAFVLLQIGVLINDLISTVTIENFEASMKFETLMIAIFFFIFAFSIMHFPVFAYTGNFEDLPRVTKAKYAKSSLKDSSLLYQEVYNMVEKEKLFLEYDLKLNTLSEKLDRSVHHISQAINQSTGKTFPDFINTFRIEEAKKKLLEPNPETIFAISLDVGFNSKAAFYSAFKKATTLTPTEFKKSKAL